MINFNYIKDSLGQMEYGWTKPQSLIILVPGLSLIVHKIQVSHVTNKIKSNYPNSNQYSALQKSSEYKKLGTINKWHILGSLIQIISLLALTVLSLNLQFLLLIPFAIYGMHTAGKGIVRTTTYHDNRLVFVR